MSIFINSSSNQKHIGLVHTRVDLELQNGLSFFVAV